MLTLLRQRTDAVHVIAEVEHQLAPDEPVCAVPIRRDAIFLHRHRRAVAVVVNGTERLALAVRAAQPKNLVV